jgi:plastocyanin
MKLKLLISLALLSCLLAACIQQEPVKPVPEPTPTLVVTPTPMITPALTPTPTPTFAAPTGEVTVWIENYAFFPREFTVKAGTKVVWWNWIRERYEDIVILGEGGSWNSTPFGYGKNWSRVFYEPGVYNYTASFSGTELKTMKGVVIVE